MQYRIQLMYHLMQFFMMDTISSFCRMRTQNIRYQGPGIGEHIQHFELFAVFKDLLP